MHLGQCIDLCSGAGGWEVAARELGIDTLGIELDDAPVAVARAAGFSVLQADMAMLDPLDFAPCPGVIGSPPCPSFSSAGRGAGREISEPILAAIADLAAGRDTRAQRRQEAYAILEPDTAHLDVLPVPRRRRKREQHAASSVDRDRIARREAKRATAKRDAAISLLVVEPLRWALALEPRWVALEQVPPVLPIWQAMAVVLRERGYSAWTGRLDAERFGVPQTRCRAILIASLDREVREPPATHQRYIPRRKSKKKQQRADDHMGGLFRPPPERIVHRDDRDLLPWISMAEALQWGMTARPSNTVTATNGDRDSGARVLDGGSGARETLDRARAEGEWVDRPSPSPSPSPSVTAGGTEAGGGVEVFAGREARERAANAVRFVSNGQANATTRDVDEPAPTILAGGTSPGEQAWVLRSGQSVAGKGRAERSVDDPSLTITGRADLCSWERPTHFDRRQGDSRTGEYVPVRRVPVDEPAPTIGVTNPGAWVRERPSTSVNCDPPIAGPGRHDPDESGSQYSVATVRVSIEEAAALQSFPPGYPWEAAGTRTAAFKCVGNAVPCGLARAILSMATGGAR